MNFRQVVPALFLVVALHAVSVNGVQVRRDGSRMSSTSNMNPIRKVVTLLQDLQKKVTEEGKKEEEAYDKFMCYCTTNRGTLTGAIESAQAKIESLTSAGQQGAEQKEQTEASLKEHQSAKAEAKDTMAKATALREKEARAFAEVKADSDTNLAALKKAISALESGAAGSFLQTSDCDAVRRYAMEKSALPDETRNELLSFLSNKEAQGYSPQSGEVIGILKEIQDEMSKNYEAATAEETAAIKNYEELIAAKKKELEALQSQIEAEMTKIGELGVDLAQMANEAENTKNALGEDEKFQLELQASCDTKTQEWEEIKKTRAEELVTLADTIKVLNDDDALDLFKNTLGSPSLLQLQVNQADLRGAALAALKKAGGKSAPGLDLISLALKGKKVGFEKVVKMIDEMVVNLKTEQVDDDSKKEYCDGQIDATEDKQKSLEATLEDHEVAIEQAKGLLEETESELKALEAGIKALDKAVSEATELRKEENADHKELMASDSDAKKILLWAKNRLNKFYNPKLYNAPAKRELSEEDSTFVKLGGPPPPAEAPGGIAGTGIGLVEVSAHVARKTLEAPAPPPETFGPYTKKSQETNGVLAMVDLLVKDLDKEMDESTVAEAESQKHYEKLMEDSASKRAADSSSLTEKTSVKAELEGRLQTEKEGHQSAAKDIMSVSQYLASLHSECDWLLKYFDARKEARASEVDALKNAKAVLAGADFSLVQKSAVPKTSRFLERHA